MIHLKCLDLLGLVGCSVNSKTQQIAIFGKPTLFLDSCLPQKRYPGKHERNAV